MSLFTKKISLFTKTEDLLILVLVIYYIFIEKLINVQKTEKLAVIL